ncbi:oligopeptide transport system ATP-binding protein [Spiroplasma chinense]|uniref:Oligopeptide transport system ATP-binding protein n=1 Tax=Spiroplasma chinense TaxID=216932 RepID=A0A5B9Y4K3_9MOLU|nr:oligopeptide ABC transporter ATP-binding protein OppF [Spiroplasma chinense]QEH62098.1 oligopeptide transport system ATP-binding protein [Spiroplasma chinense]
MSTETKETLLNIRDLVIEFRTKGKKVQAVKNTSFDVYKGEIFGLVGESGSGKTTIGRAVVGVQPLKDGAIYMNDDIVAGKPTSLHVINKSITRKINDMSVKMGVTTKELDKKINSLKGIYNMYADKENDFDYSAAQSKLKDSKLSYIRKVLLGNLRHINSIVRDEDRMIKFVTNLHVYIPEVSVKLEKSISRKLKETKEAVLELKEYADTCYKSIVSISKIHKDFVNSEKKSVEKYFKDTFSKWKVLTDNHKMFLKQLEWVREMQMQLDALAAPKNSRKSYINYYNKLIYIDREDFYRVCVNEHARLESEGVEKSDPLYKQAAFFVKDFWSKKNFNLKDTEKILKTLLEDQTITSAIKEEAKLLRGTEFEENLKELLEKNSTLDKAEVEKQYEEFLYIKKIIEKGIVKDRPSIEFYNKAKGIEVTYTEEEIESFIELTEFLDLPSIDEIVKQSYLFKNQTKAKKRENRRNIQMIFQDPASSLNDRMAIEEIISEGLENFKELYKGEEAKQLYLDEYNAENPDSKITFEEIKDTDVKKSIVLKLIKAVGLLPEHLSRYPHEFSGGQRQRVGIARSLAMKPKLIVADEPISALDVSIRAQVLNLFKVFKEKLDLTFIFVAHDLSVVRHVADRIAVIYHGQIVELAPAEELFTNPLHPYTRALLSAIPVPEPELARNTKLIVYEPEKEHEDYIFELPYFAEVLPGHFVWANKREIREIKSKLKKG